VRIAFATCAPLPGGWPDDGLPAGALRERGAEVSFEVWDDPEVGWSRFDSVLIRSTWDYTQHRERFLEWARSLDDRLDNPPAIVEWNSDKRYLADLAAAGIATVPTEYVEPGAAEPRLEGEVVVKPAVSAGARDTGRFSSRAHDQARALLERLGASGRTAMVQPYLPAVESEGETAIVFIAGEESHALRKDVVLDPDQEAPLANHELRSAEAMFRPELVRAADAGTAERELAKAVVAELARRFGTTPLYARVDMLRGQSGEPVLLELEAVEPSLYFEQAPGSARRFADALLGRRGSA
jgi:glutathione synthase/RimK-type ligase-like ATP-grasp enzyme